MVTFFWRRVLCLAMVAAEAGGQARPNTLTAQERAAGWQLLFDGKSLDGWRASDTATAPGTFTVYEADQAIVVRGPRSHLYYVGPVQRGEFRNFELKLDVHTFPRANSGVYFHTKWQPTGWPDDGYEVQVNNSHSDPKRTAGLYDVRENYEAVAKDGEWFTLSITVRGKRVVTRVNGKVVVDYTEPAGAKAPEGHAGRLIGSGTFALQGHDPASEIHYRNIKVRAF